MDNTRKGKRTAGQGATQSETGVIGATLRGLIAAFIVALAAGFVVTIALSLTTQLKLEKPTMLLINYLSIATGAIIAARTTRRRGWLVGGLTGLLYSLIGLAIGEGSASLAALPTFRGVGVSTLLGLLAGVIGVNL